MALSGLDIYKLLPKTNCRDCGFPTCLAFAMQLAKKATSLDKCPHISKQAKEALELSSLPPIRLVTIGTDDNKLEVGNETVLFRHDEKFYHPTGIGFVIEDDLPDGEIKDIIKEINSLKFERVGQELNVNLIAIMQRRENNRFIQVTKLVLENSKPAIVLMSNDLEAMRGALQLAKDRRPLLIPLSKDKLSDFAKLASEFKVPLTVPSSNLEEFSSLTKNLNEKGIYDLVLDMGKNPPNEMIWSLTQTRRLALKKQERSLGYPTLVVLQNDDPYLEIQLASTYIAKYASIILMQVRKPEQVLSILTLRQNIYTDPQKPLQIEPKLYPIGSADKNSPVLVTTNFSLTYYTVLGEVEASKRPSYILSVYTEGMSVLTAWAAEKFTPDSIVKAMDKSNLKETVSHQRLIIPGYVAVMSGDLEEQSGWQVAVGPKEASGIPSFLKNL